MGPGRSFDRDDVFDRTHGHAVGQRLVRQNLELRAGKIPAEKSWLAHLDVCGESPGRIRGIQHAPEAHRKFSSPATSDAQPVEPGANDQAWRQSFETLLLI